MPNAVGTNEGRLDFRRFLRGLFAWVGFRSIGLPYERPPRATGRTKWNYWKLWNFALDGFVSFSTIPLRAGYLGAAVVALAFLYGVFIVAKVCSSWGKMCQATPPL